MDEVTETTVHEFGTEAYKLHRTDSIDTSKDAAESVNTTRLERMVYEAVSTFGDYGCTQDDVLSMPQFKNLPYSSVTARFSSLLHKKYIKDTTMRRKGRSGRNQRVVRVTDLNTQSED